MALLKFLKGNLAKLSTTGITEGQVYITEDSQEMYVDIDSSTRISISGLRIVASEEDLTTLGASEGYSEHILYYVEDTKALKKYNGTSFDHLNDTADLVELGKTVVAHTAKIEALEAKDADLQSAIDALDASTIGTTDEIIVTTQVGNYEVGHKIDSNKSMQDVLKEILCSDSAPAVTVPKLTFSAGSNQYLEVGSSMSQTISISYEDGNYQYGFATDTEGQPDTVQTGTDGAEKATAVQNDGTTGATVTKLAILYDGTEQKTASSGNTLSATINSGIQKARASKQITATVSYTAGNIPVSILKNKYKSKAISAGTDVKVKQINNNNDDVRTYNWYIPMYHGFKYATGALVADPANISASEVKGLTAITGASAFNQTKPTTETATASWRQYFVAVPASLNSKTPSIIDGNNLPLTVQKAKDVTLAFSNDTEILYNVFYVNLVADYDTKKITLNW